MQLGQGSGRIMRIGAVARRAQEGSAGLIRAGRARAAGVKRLKIGLFPPVDENGDGADRARG